MFDDIEEARKLEEAKAKAKRERQLAHAARLRTEAEKAEKAAQNLAQEIEERTAPDRARLEELRGREHVIAAGIDNLATRVSETEGQIEYAREEIVRLQDIIVRLNADRNQFALDRTSALTQQENVRAEIHGVEKQIAKTASRVRREQGTRVHRAVQLRIRAERAEARNEVEEPVT